MSERSKPNSQYSHSPRHGSEDYLSTLLLQSLQLSILAFLKKDNVNHITECLMSPKAIGFLEGIFASRVLILTYRIELMLRAQSGLHRVLCENSMNLGKSSTASVTISFAIFK